MIGRNEGASRRIIDATSSAVRRTAEAAECAEALAGVMNRVTEMFRQTESTVAGLLAGIEEPAPRFRIIPLPHPFAPLPPRTMAAPLTGRETVTPDWLAQAAAAAFSTSDS